MQLDTVKQKRRKLFILSCLMMVVLFLSGCGGARVTKTNYDKIYNGMSFNEVVQILGDDYEVSSSAGFGGYNSSCYIWEGFGGANITIIFLNGEVFSKAQAGL
ncbi:MAG: DUF3862 domain-containing protein [Clostridia bacterium]|nr:DUF3862 domain-containing protein [Clostridia bacterium]